MRFAAVVAFAMAALYFFFYFDFAALPKLPVQIVGNYPLIFFMGFSVVSIGITLWLRPTSLPHRLYSRWWMVFLCVLVISIIPPALVRALIYQPFSTPGGSMVPTLVPGDRLFADKLAYGYGPYSFPFSDVLFGSRPWPDNLNRGDIVVFRLPQDPQTSYIKRVIGLPGDTVQMVDGYTILNGVRLSQEKMSDYLYDGTTGIARYRETLPFGRSYTILNLYDNTELDNTPEFEVPDNSFFVLGDNRDNSLDSRLSMGMIPIDNLAGKAVWIYANSGGDLDRARQDLSEN
ncbi:signal peptidase I [Hoeflea prorocentri]|uniref:Signal peptidase I n=1 Tax=Hoeflea prorocentri TaxID=1922333 RepID=A0A9X3UQD3_9HYPH|nr:signal peptidase I [Hoeflea prorocentri]MCY6383449.1 signal peptidase I [Hoeflea prorocentri]MDA5401249.1 signal peptidase I [Hoeflea prorocentri]